MTFCGALKQELSAQQGKTCCRRACLFGALLFSSSFGRNGFRAITASEAVAERLCEDMEYFMNFAPKVKIAGGDKRRSFVLTIDEPQKLAALFSFFYPDGADKTGINHLILQNECDRIAFLRGAFMTGGTVTDPMKSYYLDFTTPSLKLSDETVTLLRELELEPSTVLRRGTRVIYFRGSEKIEALLQTLSAFNGYFDFVNAKIEKDVRNGVNRTLNCDSGNTARSMAAAKKQIKAVLFLKSTGRLDGLDYELRRLAELRAENEEASLQELGMMCDPRLSKTAVYTRLNKLTELAKSCKKSSGTAKDGKGGAK